MIGAVLVTAAAGCQVKEGVNLGDDDAGGGADTAPDAPDASNADHPPDAGADMRDAGGSESRDAGAMTDAPPTRDLGVLLCPPPDLGDAGAGDGADAAAPQPKPDVVTFVPSVVSTVVGGASAGRMDGPAATATLSNPVSVLFEPGGTLLVCDFDNARIRRVDTTGAITTLTTQENLPGPFGLVRAPDGTVYLDTDFDPTGYKDRLSGTLWRLDPATGAATVVAIDLGRPRALAAMPDGRLVLGDYQGARVRLFDPGTSSATDLAGLSGCPGFFDGRGSNARFGKPYGLAVLPSGQIVVSDYDNHRLRVVAPDGQVSTWAGDGVAGTIDGPRATARFVSPLGLALDAAGNLYVSDAGAHRIRRVGADDVVTTVAGDGTEGFADGPGDQARFFGQEGIAVSPDGKAVFVADGNRGDNGPYNRIRRITIGP